VRKKKKEKHLYYYISSRGEREKKKTGASLRKNLPFYFHGRFLRKRGKRGHDHSAGRGKRMRRSYAMCCYPPSRGRKISIIYIFGKGREYNLKRKTNKASKLE